MQLHFRSCKKVNIRKYDEEELLKEIQSKKISKYKELYDCTVDTLLEDERKMVHEYGKQKEALQLGANYLAGLIRGAGPLLHKMLQGIPEDTLPPEIRVALRDVKSKLPPIPERLVKSQMNSIIERSNKRSPR